MSDRDLNLERLIVRGLDGGLREDERLALDRELIRNPEARRLMDEFQRIDALAGDALRALLREDRPFIDSAALTVALQRRRRFTPHRSWWLIPGAVAAALLAVFVARWNETPSSMPHRGTPVARYDGSPRENLPASPTSPWLGHEKGHGPFGGDLLQTISTTPTLLRDQGRNVIGVMGEDGNLYWLEIDHTRSYRRVPIGAGMGVLREAM